MIASNAFEIFILVSWIPRTFFSLSNLRSYSANSSAARGVSSLFSEVCFDHQFFEEFGNALALAAVMFASHLEACAELDVISAVDFKNA